MKVKICNKWEYREAKQALDDLFNANTSESVYYAILEAVRDYEKRHKVPVAIMYCPYSIQAD